MLEYLVGLLCLYVLDLSWINSPPIKQAWSLTVRSIQKGTPMTPNVLWAIVAYTAMGVALTCIAIPFAETKITKRDSWSVLCNSLWTGGLTGFVIYDVFDVTNAAIFTGYPTSLAILDIAWGTFVFAVSTCAALIYKCRVIYKS